MSKIVVMMIARNEEWVIGLSARAVLLWADHLIICDHNSTDRTHEIAREVELENIPRVTVTRWTDPEWTEMNQRQKCLETAREEGATHVCIVDADEVLTGGAALERIRQDIESCPIRTIFQLPWLQLRGGIFEYIGAGTWADQWVSTAFRDDPEHYHWAQRDGYDFHHRQPMGRQLVPFRPLPRKLGGLMHLQMASERRLKAKQALYKMTEVIRWPGRKTVDEINRMYNVAVYCSEQYRSIASLPMAQVKQEWWAPYQDLVNNHLRVHADPWQEAEAKRLWAEHGAEKFRGLDLYGVI